MDHIVQKIGRYEIVGELGRGAMGVVYSAMDPLIGRRIAIKTIRLDTLDAAGNREELTRRLFREAQSAGVLSHPGIITIHDVGEQGNEAYIVMEYVDGRNLEDVLASGIPQHSGVLLSILKQAASALDYAHGKGIIHRDIKPSNVMLCHNGVVKIADFGVAKLTASSSMTQAGLVLGTPSYMSPEQAQGLAVDGNSDQFSLAVVAYRMLTGELPFQGTTLTAILTKILLEEPQYDSSGLHPYLQTVFKRALAKTPQSRFPSCTDFIQDLETAYALCRAAMPGIKPDSAEQGFNPADSSAAAPPAGSPEQGNPLQGSIPGSMEAPRIAREVESQPVALDLPSPEKPAAAEGKDASSSGPSSASDAGIQPPRQKSRLIAWATSLVIVALVIAAFFAIKTGQSRRSPADSADSNAAETTISTTAQDNMPAAPENKPAVALPSEAKPEEQKPEPAATGMPDAGGMHPDKAAPAKPRQAPAAIDQEQPESGIIAWTGKLGKNSVLVITPPEASVGSITGEFPGKPVSIEVVPKELTIRQIPNSTNGYMQLMLYSGPSKYTSITIHWKTVQ